MRTGSTISWRRRRAFLRGCIRSDGCDYVNRTGPSEYLSYGFHNHSTEILDLSERVCRAVDLDCRRTAHDVRIYRRASVGPLLEHVGVKR